MSDEEPRSLVSVPILPSDDIPLLTNEELDSIFQECGVLQQQPQSTPTKIIHIQNPVNCTFNF